MKINLNDKYFIDFDEREIPVLLKDELIKQLTGAVTKNPIRFINIANEFKNNGYCQINEEELQEIKRVITLSGNLSNIAKYRLLEVLVEENTHE